MVTPDSTKVRRAVRRARGLCVDCGRKAMWKLIGGQEVCLSLCTLHVAKKRAAGHCARRNLARDNPIAARAVRNEKVREHGASLAARGYCRGGKRHSRPAPGYTRCTLCLAQQKERSERRKVVLRESNLCTICGHRPAGDKNRCFVCIQADTTRKRRMVAHGFCQSCEQPLNGKGQTKDRCGPCSEKQRVAGFARYHRKQKDKRNAEERQAKIA